MSRRDALLLAGFSVEARAADARALAAELERMARKSAADTDLPTVDGVPAVAGLRVCRWHESFPGQADPVPGTLTHAGAKFVTVDWDDAGTGRVEPRNLSLWSEPREH